MDCGICAAEFTTKSKKRIDCPYCYVGSCLGCLKQCSLMWASAPKCPHCNKAYSTEFIDSTFAKGFRRGRLRIAAVQNLQEQEMSLLPQTMLALEQRIKRDKYIKAHIELKIQFDTILSQPCGDEWPYETIKKLEKDLRDNNVELSKRKKIQSTKTIKCPKDNCNGFILSTTCALCNTKVCKDCNSLSEENHECSQDAIESWKLIKETTVQCPKCYTHIQKISGCNQMWCTVKNCNTAFDWQTGKIINGPLHNPHYHEYLQIIGQNGAAPEAPQELACQTPIQIMSNARVAQIYSVYKDQFNGAPLGSLGHLAMQYLRAMTEIFDYFLEPEAYGPRTYEKLRMDYLEGLITKKRWASRMSHRETIRTKKMKIWALRQMYQNAAADIFGHLLTESIIKMNPSEDTLRRFTDSHETLRLYYAKEMNSILSDYSDTTGKILVKENHQVFWTNANLKQLNIM